MNKIQELELMLDNMDKELMEANKNGIPFEVDKEFPLKWLSRPKEYTQFYAPKKQNPMGYYPKIEYWSDQLVQAVKKNNIKEIDRAHNRLNHFINQQWKVEFGQ